MRRVLIISFLGYHSNLLIAISVFDLMPTHPPANTKTILHDDRKEIPLKQKFNSALAYSWLRAPPLPTN